MRSGFLKIEYLSRKKYFHYLYYCLQGRKCYLRNSQWKRERRLENKDTEVRLFIFHSMNKTFVKTKNFYCLNNFNIFQQILKDIDIFRIWRRCYIKSFVLKTFWCIFNDNDFYLATHGSYIIRSWLVWKINMYTYHGMVWKFSSFR